jgi:hypothetical protein
MVKKITLILSIFILLSSCAGNGIDLEKFTLDEEVSTLLTDKEKKADQLEQLTGLPGYLVSDVKDYKFGPVDVPNGSSVELLVKSLNEKELAGIDVSFKTDTSSKIISSYLFKKYGKPKTLQNEQRVYDSSDNAYRSSEAYLWSNIKPGISMVLLNKNEEINKQPWHTSELIILKNDVTPASPLNNSTSLNRVIQNYTPLE